MNLDWFKKIPDLSNSEEWERTGAFDFTFNFNTGEAEYVECGTLDRKLKAAKVVVYRHISNQELIVWEYRHSDTDEPFLIRWREEAKEGLFGAALFIEGQWLIKNIDEIINWIFSYREKENKKEITRFEVYFERKQKLTIKKESD